MSVRLTIETAGPGVTIQDGGRTGYLRFGVTPAGPMDWVAFETANRVLGNAADAAAFEIGLGGFALSTDAPLVVAFAGGAFAWSRGPRSLPGAARVLLCPGETLRARPGATGAFAYCAVAGGIDLPAVMGSRATHTRSSLGGVDGRALRAGDTLRAIGQTIILDDAAILAPWLAPSEAPFRLVPGPQDDHFDDMALATLCEATYTLTASADRMAYKLDGAALTHARDFNIVSDGVALGAVQVAGDGLPMVLMADRQPTGGYPKIAHVCRADIGRLAQSRPGDRCRFARIDVETARNALFALQDRLASTLHDPLASSCLAPLRVLPTPARLARSNLISGIVDAGTDPTAS